jgi:hypothetical protein
MCLLSMKTERVRGLSSGWEMDECNIKSAIADARRKVNGINRVKKFNSVLLTNKPNFHPHQLMMRSHTTGEIVRTSSALAISFA